MAFRAPLLGYNTNVRHKGKLYHIQTEDSGVDHPHVITHLFADGGRIVASKKTSYAERVGEDRLQDVVKKLMQGQHKAMFIALRDGMYDEDASDETDEPTSARVPAPEVQQTLALAAQQPEPVSAPVSAVDDDDLVTQPPAARGRNEPVLAEVDPLPAPNFDAPTDQTESLEPVAPPVGKRPPSPNSSTSAVFKAPKADPAYNASPARGLDGQTAKAAPRSLFGGDLLSDKSLDEVILNYLAANEKDA